MNNFGDLLEFAEYVLSLFTNFARDVISWLMTDFTILDLWEGNIIEFLFGIGVPILLSTLLIKGIINLVAE